MGLLGRVIKYSTAGKSFEECWKVELLKESEKDKMSALNSAKVLARVKLERKRRVKPCRLNMP